MRSSTREAMAGSANVFMLGRGISRQVMSEFTPTTSLALMLSASAAGHPQGSIVTPIGPVEEALRLGADAVVVYVALAGENEAEMINYTSRIGETCDAWSMPFITEAEFPNAYQTLTESGATYGAKYLQRNALTGEAVVDYSNASSTLLLDVKKKAWSPRLLQMTGLDEARLGRVEGATSIIGPLTPVAAERLIFLPCLSGTMTPTWNADARGVFFGLSMAHGRGHMVRALLEGTAYGLKDNVDRMAEIGLNPQEIRAVARGARGRLWLQIKADVTGRPVSVPREPETTALGAAMLAGVAGGLFPNLQEAASAAVRIETTIEPNPAHRQAYNDAYALYREVYDALQKSFRKAAKR